MQNPFQIPAICLMTATSLFAYEPTSFVTSGKLVEPRTNVSSAVLKDGRLLIAGGRTLGRPMIEFEEGALKSLTRSDVEILNPLTGDSRPARNEMTVPRVGHTMVTLRDGKVLAIGGISATYIYGWPATLNRHNSAELFNPVTETWESVGSLNTLEGVGLKSILLKNGHVLVVGSEFAETYDPMTQRFTNVGSLIYKRDNATLNRLPNGDVLVTGASNGENVPAEIFRGFLQRFVTTGTPNILRTGAFTATTLKDGRVVIAGDTLSSLVEIYDPQTGEFTNLCYLRGIREGHTATLLADGRVALAGGLRYDYPSNGITHPEVHKIVRSSAEVEIVCPKTATSQFAAALKDARVNHGATLTKKGNLLVFGGNNTSYSYPGVLDDYENINTIESLIFKKNHPNSEVTEINNDSTR